MSRHERRLSAMERLITNPSPAVKAYLKNYRRQLSALDSDDAQIFNRAIETSMAFWDKLTPDEQMLLVTINREN